MGFNFILRPAEGRELAVFYTFRTGKTRIVTTSRTLGNSPCEELLSARYSSLFLSKPRYSWLFLSQILDTQPPNGEIPDQKV